MTSIHLGFEVGTGAPVAIPLKHMAVTGMTQEAGKTTTLEALIARSQLRAIAFVTKRGEGGFSVGNRLAPFFEERTDWEFIESILESTMHQRMKFERAWIVRACKGARTLADVQRNVLTLMDKSKRSMDKDIYMLLGEYLRKVVPLVASLPKADRITLAPGLNVVNLLTYPEELQMLVVSSTLRWIHQNETNVVTIIPEAWKFVPQSRKTPVKIEVERLAREGAGIRNYIWIDSQDIAGVEKVVLRSAAVWLIGIQREANEIKRALASIPAGIKKPKPEAVAQLGLGEFFACWNGFVFKTYVQPEWLSEDQASRTARGEIEPLPKPKSPAPAESEIDVKELDDINHKLDQLLSALNRRAPTLSADPKGLPDSPMPSGSVDENALYERFKARLMAEAPTLIHLLAVQPELHVTIERPVLEVDGKTLRGRLVGLLAGGFFDEPVNGNATFKELQRLGFKTANPNVYKELDKLAEEGVLTKEPRGYQKVPGIKIVKKEK